MSIKKWITRDFSDITDPVYKNELKANRFLGITLFLVGVISLLVLILQLTGVFVVEKHNQVIAYFVFSCFFSFSGAIYALVAKDSIKYVKYVLIVDLLIVTVLSDLFLSCYSVLFLAIPFICVSRYANKKFVIHVSLTILLFIVLNGFAAYHTNFEKDLNVLANEQVKAYIDDPSSLTYWAYTTPYFTFSVLPKFAIAAVISALAILNSTNQKNFSLDALRAAQKEERIVGELNLAREIQASMLPSEFPPFPNVKNFDIYANMVPAKEIGGDMYDFYFIDDQHLAIVIADVSGKGIPAALFMGMSKILLKNFVNNEKNLGVSIASINDMIIKENPMGLFVTTWVGILDLYDGELTYVNAGHDYPYMYKDGKIICLKQRSGMALGVKTNIQYEQFTVKFNPQDRLFLYTDGVTEATNKKNQLFGDNRLLKYLDSNISKKDDEIVNSLLTELGKFQEGKEQFDDITMVSLTFNSFLDRKNVRKEFIATVANFTKVSEFIETNLEEFEVPLKYINQMNIAVEEIFTNIAKYGFKGEGNGVATVDITYVNKVITITTFDNSPSFDPFKRKDPDITLTAEDRPIGGLGILMVKKIMDDYSYQYKDGINIIKLVKKVD